MATIVMESAKVELAAKRVISEIEAIRAKQDRATIEKAIKYQKRFSFRRGFYTMTYDEAKQWIREQECFGNWGMSIYAWGTLAEAKALLLLAQHGDPVTLNADDVKTLFG